MQCKICPICGEQADVEEIICKVCITPLDSVEVVSCDEKNEILDTLELILESESINIVSGDVVGREEKVKEILKKYPTVSRRHVKFLFENEKWYVEDLSSTNGIYINDNKQLSNAKILLHNGDILSLSKHATFKVLLWK
jgi:pSer/pThr/pTyr-binding forkhead associated (FHA) protein